MKNVKTNYKSIRIESQILLTQLIILAKQVNSSDVKCVEKFWNKFNKINLV